MRRPDKTTIFFIFWVLAILVLISIFYFLHENDKLFVPQSLHVPDSIDTMSVPRSTKPTDPEVADIDSVRLDSTIECRKKFMTLSSTRYLLMKKSITYFVCEEMYNQDVTHRSSLSGGGSSLYNKLLTKENWQISNEIASKFTQLAKDEDLDQLELIKIIVNTVQEIPYTLVHPFRHDEVSGGIFSRIHNRLSFTNPGGEWGFVGGCAESVEPFGVFSPLEVAYHHMADCDSRTLFLFAVLRSIGYDVVILNSDVEGHSILGVNLQNLASFFGNAGLVDKKSNKKYLVWETTSEMDPGFYPQFNVDDWYIALK